MSNQAENNYRLELYDELDDIITAMRNLAQVEMVRLEKAYRHQQQLFASSQATLKEFLSHYGTRAQHNNEHNNGRDVLLVLGSERGFCGGFNEQTAQYFRELTSPANQKILIVGSRVANKLRKDFEIDELSAPIGMDDALTVLQTITTKLFHDGLPQRLEILYHARDGVKLAQLLPFATNNRPSTSSLNINLEPTVLRRQLEWHFLQQALMQYLVVSLHTENRWRLQQMEGARDHLEELTDDLRKRINAQRQQQIVEEIEVILSEQTIF